ncbi:hypothetical protein BDF19DRAFT_211917 [Syncephalis fuscata]|nr:hypothetical protein BDF19DRAFT_211917 [Syncephalis fuscata]
MLDEVATSVRSWNYQLEERIDEIADRHERLKLREEAWQQESGQPDPATMMTPHRRSRRLQGSLPDTSVPATAPLTTTITSNTGSMEIEPSLPVVSTSKDMETDDTMNMVIDTPAIDDLSTTTAPQEEQQVKMEPNYSEEVMDSQQSVHESMATLAIDNPINTPPTSTLLVEHNNSNNNDDDDNTLLQGNYNSTTCISLLIKSRFES